ncbi:MAG: porphobilinogen synthase, partial [Puniceicoccales bacterium]
MRRLNLPRRPRRLRRTAAIRELVTETAVTTADLVHPLFVIDGEGVPQDIGSLPGQQRLSIKDLVSECEELHRLGVRGVALFPSIEPALKDAAGSEALNPETLVLRAIRAVKQAVPDLSIFTDIALDPYTDHGHDGIFNKEGTDMDNDGTVEILRQMSVLCAEAGADFVAPSDMMDGRVEAIRESLDDT